MGNGLFAKYISKRKVTQQEIEELYAYPNAVVTTTVWGISGLAATLNTQFKGEDFQEILFDGNLTERDATQCLNGYVRYWVEVDYCKGIGFYGEEYAREESWGGMHKYV